MSLLFFFSSRRRHTRCSRDWSSDVCPSDLPDRAAERPAVAPDLRRGKLGPQAGGQLLCARTQADAANAALGRGDEQTAVRAGDDRERDAGAPTATRVGRGRHSEVSAGALVHAAARSVPGGVGRRAHPLALVQLPSEALETPRVAVLAGRPTPYRPGRAPPPAPARGPGGGQRGPAPPRRRGRGEPGGPPPRPGPRRGGAPPRPPGGGPAPARIPPP